MSDLLDKLREIRDALLDVDMPDTAYRLDARIAEVDHWEAVDAAKTKADDVFASELDRPAGVLRDGDDKPTATDLASTGQLREQLFAARNDLLREGMARNDADAEVARLRVGLAEMRRFAALYTNPGRDDAVANVIARLIESVDRVLK